MDSYNIDLEKTSRKLFPIFLIVLVVAPLPLGSNRPWAWATLSIASFAMLAIYCFQFARGRVRAPSISIEIKLVAVTLMLWVIYQIFQIIPLPNNLLVSIAPLVNKLGMNMSTGLSRLNNSISIDSMNSLMEIIKSVFYFSIFILTILLVNRQDRLRNLMMALVISGVLQAVLGITTALLVNGSGYENFGDTVNSIVKGTFINRNHFAGFINLSIAAAVGLILAVGVRERRQIHRENLIRPWQAKLLDWRQYLAFYISLMIIALVFSQSRGGWLALATMITVGGITLFMQKGNYKELVSNYAAAVVVLCVILFFISGNVVVNRISDVGDSAVIRLNIWSDALTIIKQNWLVGIGDGNFQYIFPLFDTGINKKSVLHAHNDYLEMLVEQGVIGFSLFAIAVILALKNALSSLINSRKNRENAFAISSVMAISGFMAHGLIDFNFQVPSNAMYLFVFIAIATLQGNKALQTEKRDVAWEENLFEVRPEVRHYVYKSPGQSNPPTGN